MPKNVLVQKGHHAPREPGFEGGTGANGEQEVAGVIGDRLANLLRADSRFAVKVCPGRIPDDVKNGSWRVDAFLSLHCDGSNDPNRGGWGVGYPDGPANRRLASYVGLEIGRFHRSRQLDDNYTRNMSGYYGYSRVPTRGPEVLVEHGFSSNPVEKAWMLENAGRFAKAHYLALCRYFGLEPEGETPAPRPTHEVLDGDGELIYASGVRAIAANLPRLLRGRGQVTIRRRRAA